MGKPYKAKKYDLAGFDLFGRRQSDGTIMLGIGSNPTPMDDFPKEVEVLGVVYTLEYIKKNDDPLGKLANDHPGKNIEWGIYC